ncbi:hypothetical protein GCM10023195_01170 [Actinoallomurus liliacearum]|uniref:SGNH hydrolase-type esterase domain-containing protein n=2 Tax=Actinoallomurus liliacearum TaxID=1080073 RepID=A0ABP8TC46_9ACTN
MTQAGRITWPDSGMLRVNFLGDSVGYRGSFASTRENSWRYLMRARLESVGPVTYGTYTHTHNANGNTVFTSLSNVSGGEDVTFVMLGTNNVREAQEYGGFYSDCAYTLDQVRAAAPDALLVVGGVWMPSDGGTWTDCRHVARYDALIAEQAHRHDGMYVPFTDLFDDDSNRNPTGVPAFGAYTTDGFHPNDAGHRAIYDRYRIALGL